jgi:5-methylcytosine-specific restriction protein A
VVDHVVGLAEGGTNDPTNLQPLCQPCHDLKTAQESARARGARVPTSVRAKPTTGADGWPRDPLR